MYNYDIIPLCNTYGGDQMEKAITRRVGQKAMPIFLLHAMYKLMLRKVDITSF